MCRWGRRPPPSPSKYLPTVKRWRPRKHIASLVAVCATVLFAGTASAQNCGPGDVRMVGQKKLDFDTYGIENRIALPELAGLWDPSRGHILNSFSMEAGACADVNCFLQVGNALETITGIGAPSQTTTGWRPYVSLKSPYGVVTV